LDKVERVPGRAETAAGANIGDQEKLALFNVITAILYIIRNII